MKDAALFFSKFLRHGTAIASLAPSSPWLSRATVGNIDWSTVGSLVELGAGTGPITQVIAERLQPHTRFLAIERDPDFVRILEQKFADRPQVEVIGADVRDLAQLLRDRGLEKVDYVVSGLPVPSFPRDLQRDLFRVVREILSPEGTFNQITELPWVYLNFYRKHFDDVRFQFEPRNIPPAVAYFCKGPRAV